MLEFARWKYGLVVLVILIGLLFALPNVFGQDLALQVERKNRAPMDDAARQSIEELLAKQQVTIKRDYLDSGRLVLAFNDVASQLKARDTVEATMSDVDRSALAYASRAPAWMRKLGLKAMPLGLDLRGGLYLLYQVDLNGAVSQLLDSYEQSFRHALSEAKLPFTDITQLNSGASNRSSVIGNDGLLVTLPAGTDVAAVEAALKKVDNSLLFSTDQGASGSGNGPSVRMTLTPAQLKAREEYALEQNRTTLTNRVNELGVSEPIVQRQGLDRINVQLPGVQNSAEVKDLLGKVATLEMRLVDTQNNPLQAQESGHAPLGSKLYKREDGSPILLKREVIVTGDELTSATATAGQDGPEVSIKLDARGADSMFRTTRLNVGKPMAVVYIEKTRRQVEINGQKVDRDTTSEKVINVATIRGVFGPQFAVSGLGQGEAHDLSLLLRSGSLAAPITVVEERAIGPSLGADNIQKGVHALEIGMLAVFVFMALYYHAFGLVADAVLLANVILLTALLSLLHASLSLPGIAGIILTVGIAVDANVLIYERIREELRNGVSPQAAIRAGFDKAFSAIADSNVTALIAGLALWVIGSGPIRGFAIVLTLGIATSMFTSLLGSRALITLMYGGRRKVAKLSIG
ncbi:MAG TPA: protein translocase subunit SecD [Steroidobacteraceae bacterium]|jgi:preprotein translocase subunit SecD|nr:protein translocase subunit SecD [Steroidobacteraceae bacterium]